MKWAGQMARMGKKRNAYNVTPEGMKTLDRSRRRWKYDMKMYFK